MKTIKFILSLLIIVVTAPFATGQQTISNKVAKFTKVSLNGNMEVILKKADAAEFKAELTNCESNSLDWDVKNGVLVLKLKQKMFNSSKEPKAFGKLTIYYTTLDNIKVDGSKIFTERAVDVPTLVIDAFGKAEVRMDIAVRDLRVNAANSVVTLTGEADYVTVKSVGAASVNAVALECNAATVETATNAECFISAKEKLDLKATSNSNIFYKGIPEILDVVESTLGTVQSL